MDRIEDILTTWFGALEGPWDRDPDKQKLWYQSTAEVDEALRARFGQDVERALRGELDEWADTARGCLALVLLLDQLPRNIFRNTPRAFEGDERAVGLASDAIARGLDAELRAIERSFLYMPFEHSELLGDQAKAVSHFSALAAEAPAEEAETYRTFLEYAKGHMAVIERFGRFPHRNAVLGRASTEEERAYLDAGGGFGGYAKKVDDDAHDEVGDDDDA